MKGFVKKYISLSVRIFLIVVLLCSCTPLMDIEKTTQRDELFVVSFVVNGGEEIPSQQVYKGKYAKRPENPIRDGYLFDGWYIDNNTFYTQFDFFRIIDRDVVLYAKWIKLSEVAELKYIKLTGGKNIENTGYYIGDLEPIFDESIPEYNVTVANTMNFIHIRLLYEDKNANIYVNDVKVNTKQDLSWIDRASETFNGKHIEGFFLTYDTPIADIISIKIESENKKNSKIYNFHIFKSRFPIKSSVKPELYVGAMCRFKNTILKAEDIDIVGYYRTQKEKIYWDEHITVVFYVWSDDEDTTGYYWHTFYGDFSDGNNKLDRSDKLLQKIKNDIFVLIQDNYAFSMSDVVLSRLNDCCYYIYDRRRIR